MHFTTDTADVCLSPWLLHAEESIDLVSESALHHSTDTLHLQHNTAPQLPMSSSVPSARAREMKRDDPVVPSGNG